MRKDMLRCAMVVFVALGMGAAAQAQTTSDVPPSRPHFIGRIGPGSFAFDRIVGGFGGKVVTNAPFSAQVTRTTNQVLADGTKINRTETGSIARDAVGRTRRDITLTALGPLNASGQTPHIVFIQDPTAGEDYILNENRKTVRTFARRRKQGAEAHRAMRMSGMRGMMARRQANEQEQSLGTKTVDGVMAQGTLYARTIPAGKIGNDKPILITTEEWYSPQLQMVISRTRKDPRFGTTTYQLSDINLNEPSPSLFTVPPDYTNARAHMWRNNRNGSQGGPNNN